MAAHPRRLAAAVLAPLAFVIFLACTQAALAAVQLNYFNVIAFPNSVTLEWSTASEVNLAGFDIQCKQAGEPDTAYHAIGFERARGGPNVGAIYNFPVTSGLVPGASYCFRLKEITTDGSPGEVIDRCGYGPMVTPTPGFGAIPVFTPAPVQTDAFGNPIIPTPTVPAVATDAFGNPILPTPFPPPISPLPQPFATDAFGNPIPPTPQAFATDAFGNPIPVTATPQAFITDVFGNQIPVTPTPLPGQQFNSPLPTPSVPAQAAAAAYDEFGNLLPPGAQNTMAAQRQFYDINRNPLSYAQLAAAPQQPVYDEFGSPVPADQVAAALAASSAAAGLPPAQAAAAASGGYDAFGNPLPPGQTAAQVNVAQDNSTQYAAPGDPAAAQMVAPATPTVAYVVVTATPTQAPVALAPVLTPLPTATPMPAGVQLVSSLDSGGNNLAQNLMVMLLCLTFAGASGIGIIGLITSVMFMRARTSQRDFYERTSVRRRY
jgi:hypothetical protein